MNDITNIFSYESRKRKSIDLEDDVCIIPKLPITPSFDLGINRVIQENSPLFKELSTLTMVKKEKLAILDTGTNKVDRSTYSVARTPTEIGNVDKICETPPHDLERACRRQLSLDTSFALVRSDTCSSDKQMRGSVYEERHHHLVDDHDPTSDGRDYRDGEEHNELLDPVEVDDLICSMAWDEVVVSQQFKPTTIDFNDEDDDSDKVDKAVGIKDGQVLHVDYDCATEVNIRVSIQVNKDKENEGM